MVLIKNSLYQMNEFAKKHLRAPFALDGMQFVNSRDAILGEIISNSLAHRDYSSFKVFREIGLADELGAGMNLCSCSTI